MRCPSCGFVNPEGMKYCGQCASSLGRRCPQCGFGNPSGFAFCGQCAAPLTEQPPAPRPQAPLSYTPSHLAEKILTSKTALEGERKQVTVLFADLKGSMELLADRDPEQALAALEHLSDSRAATEQAIDLQLGLRTVLTVLGEVPGRMLDHLRRAESLAQTLGDQRQLGRVYADIGLNSWVAGEVDRAIVYGQRVVALAEELGMRALQAHCHLGLGSL
jgi:Double zinc ribbon